MKTTVNRLNISDYRFLKLLISTKVIENHEMFIEKNNIQKDLASVYDNEDVNFLFEDVCKKESIDNNYVDLSEAFLTAQTFGLLTIVHNDSDDIKYIINLTEAEANNIISKFNKNEIYAMVRLIQLMNEQNNLETSKSEVKIKELVITNK